MVRKATSMKEINERREAAENLQRLEHANREQAKTIKELELKFNALTIDYRTVLTDKKELDQCIDKLLHDKKEPPTVKRDMENELKLLNDYLRQREVAFDKLIVRIYKLEHPEAPRPNGSALKDLKQEINEVGSSVVDAVLRISSLEEELRGNNKPTTRQPIEDDVVYRNAMQSMRLDVPPTITDWSFVQTGIKKYPKEVRDSKQFSKWANKWEDELVALTKQSHFTAHDGSTQIPAGKSSGPDPFLAHEALDRTNMVMEVLYDHVGQHPFVLMHPEILEKIAQAGELLASAYQDIGNAS